MSAYRTTELGTNPKPRVSDDGTLRCRSSSCRERGRYLDLSASAAHVKGVNP